MEITFPGGVAVEACHDSFRILTDQPGENGGTPSAPSPLLLLIASVGTCAGLNALRFCQQRQIPTDGLNLQLDWERDEVSRQLTRINLRLTLPRDFPEKYQQAILHAMDQCTVKRALLTPPQFSMTVR
ncbi:MAG: OsmC family protein [Desulfuromonadaceae bacterium]